MAQCSVSYPIQVPRPSPTSIQEKVSALNCFIHRSKTTRRTPGCSLGAAVTNLRPFSGRLGNDEHNRNY
jgi:hypothetical protein